MAEDSQTPLSAADGLPVAPSLSPALATVDAPPEYAAVDRRVVVIACIAMAVGAGAALLANVLTRLIGLITNVAYYGRVSTSFAAPSTVRRSFPCAVATVSPTSVDGSRAVYAARRIRVSPSSTPRVSYAAC